MSQGTSLCAGGAVRLTVCGVHRNVQRAFVAETMASRSYNHLDYSLSPSSRPLLLPLSTLFNFYV